MSLSMTGYRDKTLSNYSYLPIVWTTFLSFRCCVVPTQQIASYFAVPWIPFRWPTLTSEGTREDKGAFASGGPSFAGSLLKIFKQQHLI